MLVDAHTHLKHYGNNLSKALEIINEKKIWTLACSMNGSDYLWVKEIARHQRFIIPCYGIHPWEITPDLEELQNKDEIKRCIQEAAIIGEIGLDFYWAEEQTNYPLQIEVLDFILKQAKKYHKIVNLHTKGAEYEILDLLKKYQLKTPIIHWYSGPFNLVKEYLKLDCYWTIGVDITESTLTKKLVAEIPLNRILTETDGPTALEWVNGEYAYPDYVEEMVKEIAWVKKIDAKTCQKIINQNFKNLLASIEIQIEIE